MRMHFAVAAALLGLVACGPKLGALEKGETGIAKEVRDGDTLVLDSGLVVHLVEITAAPGKDQKAAREALERLVVERSVQLAYGGVKRLGADSPASAKAGETKAADANDESEAAPRKRPPSALAHVYAKTEGGRWVWVQKALVLDGLAIVRPHRDNHAMTKELLAAEAQAAAAKRGLWAGDGALKQASSLSRAAEEIAADPMCARDEAPAGSAAQAAKATPVSAVKDAPAPRRRSGPRGAYSIVEGRIASVGVRESVVYLNFGDDFSKDFAVSISKANAEAWPGGVSALEALEGKTIRVRGYYSPCRRPLMRIDDASELEVRDA